MSNKIIRSIAAAAALLLSSSLVACGESANPANGAEAAGSTKPERIRLLLDWSYRPYHAGFLYAVKNGLYKDAGLDVTIEEGKGSATSATLLGQGGFDIANINVTNAVQAINKGVPISIVSVYQPKTAASFVGIKGRVSLKNPESLKGLKIGSTPGGSDDLSLSVFKHVTGINDLNVIGLNADAKTSALLSGQVDVVSGDSHAYSAIVRGQGKTPEVLALSDLDIPLLGFGLVANNSFADKHADAVKRFIEASRLGFQAAAQDVGASCTMLIDSYKMTGGKDQCVDYASGFAKLSLPASDPAWGRVNEKDISSLVDTLRGVGEITRQRPVTDYYRAIG